MAEYRASLMSGNHKELILIFFILCLIPAAAWGHQDVWLKNEQGDRITPAQNRTDPYSPRKTCGGCHHYRTITSGYHFQQGFDEMKDGYDKKRSWVLSPGMFGKWLPTAAAGRLAPKTNTDLRQVDLSTYDWIGGHGKYDARGKVLSMSCGWCHPGGGPMEYGRDARGRADEHRTLTESEGAHRKPLDGDFTSLHTPDGLSRFRESGVVEADCLICHLSGYRMEDRNEQLNRRNYRWAATVGAGLGKVTGSVFFYKHPSAGPDHPQFDAGVWNLSKRPVTSYAWADRQVFTTDGRMKGQRVRKTPTAKNCLYCHGAGDAKNTGVLHTSANDAHVKAGLICTDCHGLVGKTGRERLRHQIAKGRSPILTVRDDLDRVGMKTCTGCHAQGQYRPLRRNMPTLAKNPQPTHEKRLPKAAFHTYLVACNGCHANAQPARAMVLLDMSAGSEAGYTADSMEGVRRPSDYALPVKEPWAPWMIRGDRYAPAVPKWMQWFGEKMPNGEIRPIPLRYVRKAALAVKDLTVLSVALADGGKEKRRTVATDGNMAAMMTQLTKLGFRDIVFVSDKVYHMDKGKVTAQPLSGKAVFYPVEHGVVPLKGGSAYGMKGRPDGCMDCHREQAPFFSKMEIVNIRGFMQQDYPRLKAPNAVPQYQSWKLKGVPSFE